MSRNYNKAEVAKLFTIISKSLHSTEAKIAFQYYLLASQKLDAWDKVRNIHQ